VCVYLCATGERDSWLEKEETTKEKNLSTCLSHKLQNLCEGTQIH